MLYIFKSDENVLQLLPVPHYVFSSPKRLLSYAFPLFQNFGLDYVRTKIHLESLHVKVCDTSGNPRVAVFRIA